jgi:hypothetical protein
MENDAKQDVFNAIVNALRTLDADEQSRVFESVGTFLGLRATPRSEAVHGTPSSSRPSFSEDRTIPVKEFMLQKQPHSDVHRVACLAYYLTHYRETPHFKTLDISKLNTEAAQPKFSNAAKAVDNAALRGYLVQANNGMKQISAFGERFVQALPDLQAAKAVLVNLRPRKKIRRELRRGEPQDVVAEE